MEDSHSPWSQFRTEMKFSREGLRLTGIGIVFGLLVGLTVGLAGGGFARLLDTAAHLRDDTAPWLPLLLPLAGLPVVWMYRKGGIKTAGGTDLIVAAARGEQPVSRLLAPVIFAATLLTHLFGGSAGREGAALQFGGSLGELLRKTLRMGEEWENLSILCGMSAGFSAVFGNQITAVLFALEVSCVGTLPLGALFPCIVSSITARTTARFLGVHGVTFAITASTPTPLFYGRILILSIACGFLSILFCRVLEETRNGWERLLPNPYLRVLAGGVAMTACTLLLGTHDYLGTGQNLIDSAIGSGEARPYDFVLKLLLTALTLGAGFKGGEIVPTFAVGATFGCVLGPLLGLPAPYAAAIGMVALFCGVTNCPLTSLMLGFEAFFFANSGGFLVAVGAAFLVSGYSGLYDRQKFAFAKQTDASGLGHKKIDR